MTRRRQSGTGKRNSRLKRRPPTSPTLRKPVKQSLRMPGTVEELHKHLGLGKAVLALPEGAVDLGYNTRLGHWSMRVGVTIRPAKPRFLGRGTIYNRSPLPSGRRLYLLVTKFGRRWILGQVFFHPGADITAIYMRQVELKPSGKRIR